MKTVLLCIGLTALCFGSWPLMARLAGKTGTTGTFIMAALALLPIGLVLMRQGVDLPTSNSFWKLFIAGVMMGTGFIAYNFAITSPEAEVSITVPVISSLMIIVTTTGSIWLFSEQLTTQKVLGIILLFAGIALLRPGGEALSPPISELPVSENTRIVNQTK